MPHWLRTKSAQHRDEERGKKEQLKCEQAAEEPHRKRREEKERKDRERKEREEKRKEDQEEKERREQDSGGKREVGPGGNLSLEETCGTRSGGINTRNVEARCRETTYVVKPVSDGKAAPPGCRRCRSGHQSLLSAGTSDVFQSDQLNQLGGGEQGY